MLFNPNWKQPEVKADPFSLESLIAWLEKQPADTSYDYCEIGECLVAQYLIAQGVSDYQIGPGRLRQLGWHYIASGFGKRNNEYNKRTFGAALNRARETLAERG